VVFLIISICIGGLIVGALGRLVVPGPNRIGCLGTILVGILGSILGGVIAGLVFRRPHQHPALTFLLEVAGAALIVGLVSGSRRRPRL
jgi:uncharacterized membrane protein YeaQ/YmgE (transglycosylase-associated protein family)